MKKEQPKREVTLTIEENYCTEIKIDGVPIPETKSDQEWMTAKDDYEKTFNETGSVKEALIAGVRWRSCEFGNSPLFNAYAIELANRYSKEFENEKKKLDKTEG